MSRDRNFFDANRMLSAFRTDGGRPASGTEGKIEEVKAQESLVVIGRVEGAPGERAGGSGLPALALDIRCCLSTQVKCR